MQECMKHFCVLLLDPSHFEPVGLYRQPIKLNVIAFNYNYSYMLFLNQL